MDPNGNPVKGLAPQHLLVKLAGKKEAVEQVTTTTKPVRVLILVDQGIVADGEKWPASAEIIGDLVRFSKPDTSFALDVFGDGPETRLEFGQPREAILSSLAKLKEQPHFRGKIKDGIAHAIGLFGEDQPGDVLYIFTDGVDENSRISQSALQKQLLVSGIRVFAVYFRSGIKSNGAAGVLVGGSVPGVQQWSPLRYDPINLAEFVEQTGGMILNIVPAVGSERYELSGQALMNLKKTAALNYRAMSQFYELKIAHQSVPGESLQISMADSKFSSLQLFYPHQTSSCGSKK